jgi:hypothetical protein
VRPPSQQKKLDMGAHSCHPRYGRKCKIGGSEVQTGLSKKGNPFSKITKAKRAGDMAQVVACSPSKCGAEFKSQYHQKKKMKSVIMAETLLKIHSPFSPGQQNIGF